MHVASLKKSGAFPAGSVKYVGRIFVIQADVWEAQPGDCQFEVIESNIEFGFWDVANSEFVKRPAPKGGLSLRTPFVIAGGAVAKPGIVAISELSTPTVSPSGKCKCDKRIVYFDAPTVIAFKGIRHYKSAVEPQKVFIREKGRPKGHVGTFEMTFEVGLDKAGSFIEWSKKAMNPKGQKDEISPNC